MKKKISLNGEMKTIPMNSKPAPKYEYQESVSKYNPSYDIYRNGEIAARIYIDAFPSKQDAFDNTILIIDSLK